MQMDTFVKTQSTFLDFIVRLCWVPLLNEVYLGISNPYQNQDESGSNWEFSSTLASTI